VAVVAVNAGNNRSGAGGVEVGVEVGVEHTPVSSLHPGLPASWLCRGRCVFVRYPTEFVSARDRRLGQVGVCYVSMGFFFVCVS
jgi:hypothetical protein